MIGNNLKWTILNWLKDDAVLGSNEFTYLAFFSDSVDGDGVGTEISSTITTGRISVSWGSVISNTRIENTEITIPNVLANATIVSVAIFDLSTGGYPLFYQDLATPVTVTAGSSWTIPAGDLKIELT